MVGHITAIVLVAKPLIAATVMGAIPALGIGCVRRPAAGRVFLGAGKMGRSGGPRGCSWRPHARVAQRGAVKLLVDRLCGVEGGQGVRVDKLEKDSGVGSRFPFGTARVKPFDS